MRFWKRRAAYRKRRLLVSCRGPDYCLYSVLFVSGTWIAPSVCPGGLGSAVGVTPMGQTTVLSQQMHAWPPFIVLGLFKGWCYLSLHLVNIYSNKISSVHFSPPGGANLFGFYLAFKAKVQHCIPNEILPYYIVVRQHSSIRIVFILYRTAFFFFTIANLNSTQTCDFGWPISDS